MTTILTESNYRRQVMGCWLGKAVGGTLGMPLEGQNGPFALEFYTPVPTEMLPNDDLDLQVLWACVLDKMDPVRVDRHTLAAAWRDNCRFSMDEYGVARRNIADGLEPPQTGSFDNWFTRGMGAAIRSEIWACLAPGDPALAAKYAYEDACVDHAGEGVWAEVFFAALQSAAFTQSDTAALLDQSEATLPESSEIRTAVHDTRLWWEETHDWLVVRARILECYGNDNFTDVVMNIAFTVLGWLAGEGDFSRAICVAANCGKDTDCTAATVGALMGILDPASISEKWLAPIGQDLVVSPEIIGITPPPTLDGFTDLIVDLRTRLNGSVPDTETVLQPTDHLQITVTAWFSDTLPEIGAEAPVQPAEARALTLPGTLAHLPADGFERDVLLLNYTFTLSEAQVVRVMFNTREASRAWVDGVFAFGRAGGTMEPSLHRWPHDQHIDLALTPGPHTLLAAIQRSSTGRTAEWVAAVGDVPGYHWLPGVFRPSL